MKHNKIKRVFALLLSVMCLFVAMPFTASAATIVDSGYCGGEGDGTNLTWTLDSDGVLTISGTGEMDDYAYSTVPWYRDRVKTVRIGSGVTSIGDYAFYECSSLTSVTIPSSVTSIGDYAFYECSSLTSVTIPDGVTSIGDDAFRYCSSLTSVTIPSSVTSIGDYAFYECSSLTSVTIPDGVTSIGFGAFAGCGSLTSVTIPSSVTSIGYCAFAYCSSLTSITVASNNPAYSSDSYGVMFNKVKTELIQYPAGKTRTTYVIPNSVTSIDNYAFDNCSSLTSVTIPSSVTSIGDWAFDGCGSLTSVTIPDGVTSIGFGAFDNCSSLTSVTIPSSVTSIGGHAFRNCSSLTDVYYPGTEAQWKKIEVGEDNDDLLNATIHFGEKMPGQESTDDTLSAAIRYVPYSESIPAERQNSTFTIPAGSLPKGLSMNASGVIEGIPTELGTYIFTVTETNADGSTVHTCTLPVYSQVYADVEKENVSGYGFVETPKDNGRVPDQYAATKEDLADKTMHCEGDYASFVALYIDAKKLTRGVDYTAAPGSTKITILAETFGEFGGGTHTIAAEFKTENEQKVYTVQNYTVTGIASKELLVKVKGKNIEWADAEPFINSDNRTMTPFRAVAEALGLTAEWNSTTREAIFSNGSKTIYFPIGSKVARTSDGGTVKMDTSAVIVGGRTYAPIRFLAEYFGFDVGWVAAERLVTVD